MLKIIRGYTMSKNLLPIPFLGVSLSFISFICSLYYLDYLFMLISFIIIMVSYFIFCYMDKEISPTGCLAWFVAISFGIILVLLISIGAGHLSGPFLLELCFLLTGLLFIMLYFFGSILDGGGEWI